MSLESLSEANVFAPVHVYENDIYEGIHKLLLVLRPNWSKENITFKVFTDGITNKLVACQLKESNTDNEIVLVRIYGNKTDLLIDRKAEIKNIKILNKLGLAPQIYGIFENGLAYQYFPGETLNTTSVVNPKIWPLVAKNLAKMHKVQLGQEVEKQPIVWEKIEQFLTLIPERFSDVAKHNRFVNSFGSVTRLRIEYERLKSHLIKTKSPIVFAHNDLLLGNVIYNPDKGTVAFIDFEYAAYNYQAFDIANHFNEFVGITIDDIDYQRYPKKDFQLQWISEYLSEYLNDIKPSDDQVESLFTEVQHHSLLSHFIWGVWALIQYEHSSIDYDFGRYAEIRFNRYFEIKNHILGEIS